MRTSVTCAATTANRNRRSPLSIPSAEKPRGRERLADSLDPVPAELSIPRRETILIPAQDPDSALARDLSLPIRPLPRIWLLIPAASEKTLNLPALAAGRVAPSL